MRQVDIMPLSDPQVASPTDRTSSPISPKTPWKATGVVTLATFYENKSWPRREGKVGNVEFSKQNEAFSEEKTAQLCSIVRPPHFWLSAAFEVISKSQADLSRPFSYVQTSSVPWVGRAPTQRGSKISYMVGSTQFLSPESAWAGYQETRVSDVRTQAVGTCNPKMPP